MRYINLFVSMHLLVGRQQCGAQRLIRSLELLAIGHSVLFTHFRSTAQDIFFAVNLSPHILLRDACFYHAP